MILYHGSNTPYIEILEPRQADHDRPYIYMTTIDVVSAFYICNAVERPYYWFPYGFNKGGFPVYHELYPNALKEVSEGKKGYLYTVDANENQIIPFKNIPCARLGTEPLKVVDCVEISDAYEYFMHCVEQGKLEISRYEDKSKQSLDNWYNMIYDYINEKDMVNIPDCSYAKFVQSKFPFIWEKYERKSKK